MFEIVQDLKSKLGDRSDLYFSNPAYLIKCIKEVSTGKPELEKLLEVMVQLGIPNKYINLKEGLPADALIHRWIHEFCDFFPIDRMAASQAVLMWGKLLGLDIHLDEISEISLVFCSREITQTIWEFSPSPDEIERLLELEPIRFEGLLRDHCGHLQREIYALLFTRKYVKALRRISARKIDKKIESILDLIRTTTYLDASTARAALEVWAILIEKKEAHFIPENHELPELSPNLNAPQAIGDAWHYGIFGKHSVKILNRRDNLANVVLEMDSLLLSSVLIENDLIHVLTDKNKVYVISGQFLFNQKPDLNWSDVFAFQSREIVTAVQIMLPNEAFFLITNLGRIKVSQIGAKKAIKGMPVFIPTGSENLIWFGKTSLVELLMLVTDDGKYHIVNNHNPKWKPDNRWRALTPAFPDREVVLCRELDRQTTKITAMSESGYIKRTELGTTQENNTGILLKTSFQSGRILTAFPDKPEIKTIHIKTRNNLVSNISPKNLPPVFKGIPKKCVQISAGDFIENIILEYDKDGITEFELMTNLRITNPAQAHDEHESLVLLSIISSKTLQTPSQPEKEKCDTVALTQSAPVIHTPKTVISAGKLTTTTGSSWITFFNTCCLPSCIGFVVLMGSFFLCGLLYGLLHYLNP